MSLSDYFRTPPSAPQPTLQELRADREKELVVQLNFLTAETEALNQHADEFRSANMAIVGGRAVFVCNNWDERLRLEQTWFQIRRRAGEISAERSTIMQELCRLQDEREFEQKQGATHA